MKAVYIFFACGLFASCQSKKTALQQLPRQQASEISYNEVSDDEMFTVPFDNGLKGRGIKGAYMAYSDFLTGQHLGHATPSIKSIKPKEFATLVTGIAPATYIGKRVEYTAWIKSKDVTGWAGLWMRIDPASPNHDPSLGFDNMSQRPITGTKDWTVYHVVLDVPEGAGDIIYGALLDGDGQIWVDSMTVEIVDNGVATTDKPMQKTL